MDDKARLRRLRLLTRLREVEHREAASRLHVQLGQEHRALSLAHRTTRLYEEYSSRSDAADGFELFSQREMAHQMRRMRSNANAHAEQLMQQTEVAQGVEVAARQRRDRTREGADRLAKATTLQEFDGAQQQSRRSGTFVETHRK